MTFLPRFLHHQRCGAQLRVRPLTIAAFSTFIASQALGAEIFVEPLTTKGVPDDTKRSFETTVADAFDSAGHDVALGPRARFRTKVSVEKERSRYQLNVRVSRVTDGALVSEKKNECAPCTIEQAKQALQLLIRTVSLDIAAEEDAIAAPAKEALPLPSAPSSHAPGRMVEEEPATPPGPPPRTQSIGYTRWYKALIWTGVLPGLATTAAGVRLASHGSESEDCGGAGNCEKDVGLIVAGVGLMAVGEAMTIFSLSEAIWGEPRLGSRLAPATAWTALAASVALGGAAYLLVRNEGYGESWAKNLGFASIPLAGLAAATSIGSLIVGSERTVTALALPGYGSIRIVF